MAKMPLQNFTEKQLRAELERREKENAKGARPAPLAEPNFDQLREVCESYIDDLDKLGWVDDDHKHYIFESAMEALYGKNVWFWIRKAMS